MVTRKAAQLDLDAAQELLNDGSLSGMARTGAFTSYVRGYLDQAKGEVDWEGLVSEVKELAGVDSSGLVEAYGGAAQALASNWAMKDLEAAMDWYAGDSQRDFGNSRHSAQVASVLGALPPGEMARAVDWIAEQENSAWESDELIRNYSKQLVFRSDILGPDHERLVGLLTDEKARAEVVGHFISAKIPGGKERKFGEGELAGLIEAGGFSDGQRSALLRKMELSK